MAKKFENILIENAHIIFRDFKGESGNYPSFAVRIPDENAEELKAIGWPIKYYEPKGEDADDPFYLMNVKIRYHTMKGDDFCAPEGIILNVNGQKTRITEKTLPKLQALTIKYADVEIEWYPWVYQNRTGDGAQLEALYIEAEPKSELMSKWAEEEFPVEEDMPF